MWYLIVPPIIVVASLSFLLWYLSRRGADPVIVEKISHLEQSEPPVSFSRTRAFILRTLEKSMQHFKVISLRMHNMLHERLQSVRQHRQKMDEVVAAQREEESAVSEATYASEQVPSEEEFSNQPVAAKKHEDILATPIIRHRKPDQEMKKAFQVERPMVSETVARPDAMKKRIVRNDSREEALIGSIAVNPKDYAAYEALGDYYLEIENAKDAKECYRQVLRLSPTHRMVKIKIRRLEKLLTRDGE